MSSPLLSNDDRSKTRYLLDDSEARQPRCRRGMWGFACVSAGAIIGGLLLLAGAMTYVQQQDPTPLRHTIELNRQDVDEYVPSVSIEPNIVDGFCKLNPEMEECSHRWVSCSQGFCPLDKTRLVRHGRPSSSAKNTRDNKENFEHGYGDFVYGVIANQIQMKDFIASQKNARDDDTRRCYVIGVDGSWTECGSQGETCTLEEPQLVKYAERYDTPAVFKIQHEDFKCSRASFQVNSGEDGQRYDVETSYLDSHVLDPIWVTALHLSPSSFIWKKCSTHGHVCNLPLRGTKIVRYTTSTSSRGMQEEAVYKMATKDIACDENGFLYNKNDSMMGECSWWSGGNWLHCASFGQECRFNDEKEKRYVRSTGSWGTVYDVTSGPSFTCGSVMGRFGSEEDKSQGRCEYLHVNVTEPIAQFIEPRETVRKVSRAAYLVTAFVANISMDTPLFERPKPYVIKQEQGDPQKAFGKTLSAMSKQATCPFPSQNLTNVRGTFENPQKKDAQCSSSSSSMSSLAQSVACCSVSEQTEPGESLQPHSRALMAYDDVDDFDAPGSGGSKSNRRMMWACGIPGSCKGLTLEDLGDLLARIVRAVKGLPKSRFVRVPVKLVGNALSKLGHALFQYIPTMVQLSIYYSTSAYLTNLFQFQGFKAILMDVIGATLSVIPYTLLHTPIQTINRRVQAEGDTMKQAAAYIWHEHKLPGFLVGFGPELIRQMAFMPIWSLVQGSIELLLLQPGQGHIYSTLVQAIAGAISGGVAAFIAHPADILYEHMLKAEVGKTNMFKVAKALIQEEGFRSLYRGAFRAAQQQSLQTAVFMTVMSQMHYLLQPKQDEPPQQPDVLAAPEEAGTAEWPHSWQFDEWDAVNRSMAVKVPESNEDQSWSANPTEDQEIQETMEKWEDMSDEDKAEFVKKVSEAHYAEEQAKEAQV